MKTRSSSTPSPLGCQIWLEPDDSTARLRALVQRAAESGLSRLRIFLLWTRIEHRPGHYEFGVYDRLFDVAAEGGLGIKATLTANSGPWHLGTPGALHSHSGFLAEAQREPMAGYIRACVTRYACHPALAQWLLWNEPHGGSLDHTPDNLTDWQAWLRRRYRGRLEALNARWLTGFPEFSAIVWPEEIPHPLHRSGSWSPYAPRLDEMSWRADRLVRQVAWVAAEVRRYDPTTELGINPIFPIENKASGGTDIRALARTVDRVGSSYHPVFWHEHLGREDYPGLIGAGVRALLGQSGGKPIELTEVISGNALNTGSRSCAVGPGEIARFYLSALACGAETVTGWCLNPRPRDCEAGEFALLDDTEDHSPRSRSLARLAAVVADCRAASGPWHPAPANFAIAVDRRAQAVETLDSEGSFETPKRPGRGPNDSGRGAWLLAQRAMETGRRVTLVELSDGWAGLAPVGGTLVVSHVRAWEAATARALLAFARQGGTVVIDALSGRKDFDSRIHQPWPGHLSEPLQLTVTDLETGLGSFPLALHQHAAGDAATYRTVVRCDAAWTPVTALRFADDASPAVLQRRWGRGRFVYVRFAIGPSLLAGGRADLWLRTLLAEALPAEPPPLRALEGGAGVVTIPVGCPHGKLVVVLGPERMQRGGRSLRLITSPGAVWHEFWTGGAHQADPFGEIVLPAEDGIAVLWEKPARRR